MTTIQILQQKCLPSPSTAVSMGSKPIELKALDLNESNKILTSLRTMLARNERDPEFSYFSIKSRIINRSSDSDSHLCDLTLTNKQSNDVFIISIHGFKNGSSDEIGLKVEIKPNGEDCFYVDELRHSTEPLRNNRIVVRIAEELCKLVNGNLIMVNHNDDVAPWSNNALDNMETDSSLIEIDPSLVPEFNYIATHPIETIHYDVITGRIVVVKNHEPISPTRFQHTTTPNYAQVLANMFRRESRSS